MSNIEAEHSMNGTDNEFHKEFDKICAGFPVPKELKAWAEKNELNTLPRVFRHSVELYGDRPYLGVRAGDEFVFETYSEVYQKILSFASALVELGITPGTRIANFSNNRPEWPVVDFGTVFAACVHVPMYATLSQSEMTYIVRDSGAKVVIAATEDHLRKVISAEKDCPELEHIIAITPGKYMSTKRLWSWTEFLEFGRVHLSRNQDRINSLTEALKAEDIASIVYTSGTTGEPKGAMLMHGNFCSQMQLIGPLISANKDDVELSFLPLAHVFARIAFYYIMTFFGGAIGFAAGIHSLMQDLAILRPTIVSSVPALYDKIYARAMNSAGGGIKGRTLNWVMKVGRAYREAKIIGKIPKVLRAQHAMIKRMLFKEMHKRTGGRIRYFVSGGAPLRKEVAEFFWAVGFPLIEGYGLTETAPVLTLSPVDEPRAGSVGKVVPGVDAVFDEEGELIVRGPNVMRGYFRKPEETAAVIDEEGRFHTGDLCRLDEDDYIYIIGRKKNIIVLQNGKNVSPAPIEQSIEASPWVAAAVLIGNNRNFIGALIQPDFAKFEKWAEENNEDKDHEALAANPKVYSILMNDVREACKDLSNFEKVRKIVVLPRELSPAFGELTPTSKVKARVVEKNFAAAIEDMYAKGT